MPAAAIAFALYIFMGVHIHAPQQLPEVDWIKVVPYLVVLVTAVVGVNVMVVLVLGSVFLRVHTICSVGLLPWEKVSPEWGN